MKKRIVDEKGRLFGKVSVVDILAVILVLGLAVMVYVRFFSTGDGRIKTEGDCDVTYTLLIKGVRQYTVDALQVGDELYNFEDDPIGEIAGIETEPAVELNSTLTGQVVEMESEGRFDVSITVKARGRKVEDRYYLSDTFALEYYDTLPIKTKYVTTNGTIRSIDATEAAG